MPTRLFRLISFRESLYAPMYCNNTFLFMISETSNNNSKLRGLLNLNNGTLYCWSFKKYVSLPYSLPACPSSFITHLQLRHNLKASRMKLNEMLPQ